MRLLLLLFFSSFCSMGFAQVYFVTDATGLNITSTSGAYIKGDNIIYSGGGALTLANDAEISGNLQAQGTKIVIG